MAQPSRTFSDALAEYVQLALEAHDHDARRLLFLTWAHTAFNVDLNAFQVEERVFKGRVDGLLGDLVIEFKSDLPRELEEARAQLRGYISRLREEHPETAYTAIATDGLGFHVYAPLYDADGVTVADLTPLGDMDLSPPSADPDTLFHWFSGLLSHFRHEKAPATPQGVLAVLGPASPTFQAARLTLTDLLQRAKDSPVVQVRLREWQRYLALVYGESVGDETLFIKHTYLATVARLVALLHLEPSARLPGDAELAGVVRGRYFRDCASMPNLVEDDFFTWFLAGEVQTDGLAFVRRLMHTLSAFDFSTATEDVLTVLYQGLVDPETRHDLGEHQTPDWLAERVLVEDMGLPQAPYRSLLDPSCGSGTLLFAAIRLIKDALARRGEAPDAVLYHILENVMGMDVHPLAVSVARTTYLMALGDLLRGPRGEVTVPVFLADSMRLPELTRAMEGSPDEGYYTVRTQEPGLALRVPESLATNPAGLDHAVFRMSGQYLSALRSAHNPAETERAFTAFFAFLTTPATDRKPFVLNVASAEVLLETFRLLVDLDGQGKDTLYFSILRNALRPISLARRGFDLVVSNAAWLSMGYIKNRPHEEWVTNQPPTQARAHGPEKAGPPPQAPGAEDRL